jgi:hypothetical protein
MNKIIIILVVFLSFFIFIKFKNENSNIYKNNYDEGFRDGIDSCYLHHNLCKDTLSTNKFFLFTFLYSSVYDKVRQKGYIDGYCYAANEIYLKEINDGNVRLCKN